MVESKDNSARLSSVYIWADTEILTCEGLAQQLSVEENRYVLIIVAEGSGTLQAGDKSYVLDYGSCFVFQPNTVLKLLNQSEFMLSVFVLTFDLIPLSSSFHPKTAMAEGELRVQPVTHVLEMAQKLYKNREAAGDAAEYGNHVIFQEMIYIVLRAEVQEKDHEAIRAVEKTIEYIQASYSLELTHGKLADMAGVSLRHYSRLFQRITGKSPIDYLIDLRINRAKQMLLTSRASISEVATLIGFRDPFHFSRSFKQHTSVSPRLYINLRKQNIRVASMHYLGEMITLGVKPIGAPSQLLDGGYFKNKVEGINVIGETVVTPYLDKLSALKPDAILTFDGHYYASYSKIAPTLSISWQLPMFERFRMLAEWLGKQQEAEAWIEQYLERVDDVKAVLAERMGSEETVSFFWSRGLPLTFQVYFDMKLLYQDLGLRAPGAVSEVQRLAGHPFKTDVPLAQLARYAGDHIFIVVSQDEQSQQQFRELERSKEWRELRAVRSGRVYQLSLDWLREDPQSLQGQLMEIVHLMKR